MKTKIKVLSLIMAMILTLSCTGFSIFASETTSIEDSVDSSSEVGEDVDAADTADEDVDADSALTDSSSEADESAIENNVEPEDLSANDISAETDDGTAEPVENSAEPATTTYSSVNTYSTTTLNSGTYGDVIWTLVEDTDTEHITLIISGTGEIYDGSDDSNPWPWGYSTSISIDEVIIEDGITSIGNLAFAYFRGLANVSIASTVTRIGEYAFYNCSGLTSITIPDSVTTIDARAFIGCNGLTSITLSDSLTTIGEYAFAECFDLTSIVIPKSVTTIGENAFVYVPKDFIIYGYAGTAAETYANENGYTFIALEESADAGSGLTILTGTDATYTVGAEGGATIYCSGALADFVCVYMDGEVVDASNYTLTEGSTILTFNSSYLDTLSDGEHTVELEYTTGSVSYVLTISDEETQAASDTNTTIATTDTITDATTDSTTDSTAGATTDSTTDSTAGATTTSVDSVQTGDENNISLLVVMLAVSVCAVAGLKIYTKKFQA